MAHGVRAMPNDGVLRRVVCSWDEENGAKGTESNGMTDLEPVEGPIPMKHDSSLEGAVRNIHRRAPPLWLHGLRRYPAHGAFESISFTLRHDPRSAEIPYYTTPFQHTAVSCDSSRAPQPIKP